MRANARTTARAAHVSSLLLLLLLLLARRLGVALDDVELGALHKGVVRLLADRNRVLEVACHRGRPIQTPAASHGAMG